MSKNFNQGGRPPKLNPAVYRYVVRFTAEENTAFLNMYEKAGAINKASFIKNFLFQKPFKVFYVDENSRVFIDRLSDLNAQYRTIGVAYDQTVKALRENFTEKKAASAVRSLVEATRELVAVSHEIVELAARFDREWLQRYR